MILYGLVILHTFVLSDRGYMEDRYIKVYVEITKHSNPMRNLTEEQRKFHSDKMKRTWETKRELILINQKKGFERARKEGKYDNRHTNFTEEGKKRIYSAVSKAKSVSVLCYSLDWVLLKSINL